MRSTVICGDSLEVMKAMPDNSVDAVICDPPYDLSDSGKASPARIAAEVVLPKKAKAEADAFGKVMFERLAFEIAGLCGVGSFPQPSASVPIVPVALNDQPAGGEENVEDGNPPAGARIAYREPGNYAVPESAEYLGSFLLEATDVEALVDAFNRTGAVFLAGGIGIGSGVGSPSCPGFGGGSFVVDDGDPVVRALHDALALGKGAFVGAEDFSVPRLSSALGTVNILSARSAAMMLAVFADGGAKLVGAGSSAGSLSAVPQPDFVRYVACSADRAVAFDLLSHGYNITGKGFMAKEWDGSRIAFDPSIWREAMRVCKPGGYLLAFGGTRTFHRLMVAIEDAGWELRDTISGENVVLRWIYGSGFPKSHDVSKGVDATIFKRWLLANPEQAERRKKLLDWAKTKERPDRKRWVKRIERGFNKLASTWREDDDIPATVEAEEADGIGTAMKPSWEPIVCARAPLEGTVAENFMKHGTGGINIEATRIGGLVHESERRESDAGPSRMWGYEEGGGGLGSRSGERHNPEGRWPANLIMGHMPECERVGMKKVSGGTAIRHRGIKEGGYGGDLGRLPEGTSDLGYVGSDGKEAVEAWSCSPSCPVRGLDEQSGGLKARGNVHSEDHGAGYDASSYAFGGLEHGNAGDSGGASRFFYTAKAAKSEREMGLHGRDSRNVNDGRKTDIDNPYQRGDTQRKNTHPTVKPIAIMRWLIRLVTPKGGTVLDPFCGSGTTGVGCKLEDMDFIGIDLEAEHVDISKKRIAQASIDTGYATVRDAEEVGGPAQLGLFGQHS